MVRRELKSEATGVYWIDGRLPSKINLISRTSAHKMIHGGIDRNAIMGNPKCCRSCRRTLDRYDNFMQLVELFAKSGNRTQETSSWYAAYLLDPFTKTAEAPCLAHHLVTAKMYHKNRNNFRAFMLISDAAGFENVKKGIEKMTTTVSYYVSIPEAFEDYTEFQTDLDDFLLGVGEFVDGPPMLGTYIRSAGFTLERSIYSKL